MLKLLFVLAVAVGLLGGLLVAHATAGQGQEVCSGLDSGKIDVSGDVASITVTAPAGFLIDGYCVKAGSDVSVPDGAVVYVDVDPPSESVTFSHPSGKDISHYSLSYVEVVEPTPTPTPEPTPEPSPDPEPSEPPCTEDMECWDCETMGNEQCGPVWTPSWTPSGSVPVGDSPRTSLAHTGIDVRLPGILGGIALLMGFTALSIARKLSK